ncbi:MAG: hypothetical protein HOW73_44010, partial [Polyangiaceae bacterium]|nr:hypothetical protein [Polyangiaceae bacterium]
MGNDVGAFSYQPCPPVLNIMGSRERLDLVEEVLADLGAGEETLVLFSPECLDAQPFEYFEAWAAELDNAFEHVRPEMTHKSRWAKAWVGAAPQSPRRPSFWRADDVVAAFLSWVEDIAARLEPFRLRLVLVAFVQETTGGPILEALRRCAFGIGGTRARMVLLDSSQASLFADRTISSSLRATAEQSGLPDQTRMRRFLKASEFASFAGDHDAAMELVASARKLARTGG